MELIRKYFPELTSKQQDQFAALDGLYNAWNEKINVISRKDIEHLYEHHILHSLAIAKYNVLNPGMKILDAGTGGGFPGIPLAIVYPDVEFTLLDSTAKKIHVANEIIKAISLTNAAGIHSRLEEHLGSYDFITSRAVSTLTQLVAWSKHLPVKRWIVLKGGNPKEFRKELPPRFDVRSVPVSDFFEEEYFSGKYLVDVTNRV
jgi:16S rRNA (guanine527-N7)-methyltransferase